MTPDFIEAERRVALCFETKCSTLDLQDLALPALPPQLADCSHIEKLFLGPDINDPTFSKKYYISWGILIFRSYENHEVIFPPFFSNSFLSLAFLPQNLKELYLWNSHIEQLMGLPASLEILSAVCPKNAAGIVNLPQLKTLVLRKSNICALDNLSSELQHLDLSSNQITQIEKLPESLQSLDLSSNQITQIEKLPKSLQHLDLSSNQITQIEKLPESLQSLYLSFNLITQIEKLPESLQSLYLSSNLITQIEKLPESLQSLYLNNNQISKIEKLPESLQSLYLSSNQITQIENLPESLQSLYLNNNQISKIEKLPESLQSLDLMANQITQIEKLPESLQSLDLSSNQITQIEKLPKSLQSLGLYNNQITQIEKLPKSLQSLNLSSNQITQIEKLPESLQSLYLSFNQITQIENLPESLQSLDLMANQITQIEKLPKSLQSLDLSSNQITQIEKLPKSLQSLGLYNNQITQIEKLPKSLQSLNLSSNQITQIEKLPESLQSLYLMANQITQIENLPKSLQRLYLNNNQIAQIENLPKALQSLDLSSNQITQIENLPKALQSLYLNNNQISKIESLPESLQNLYLSDNQISLIDLASIPMTLKTLAITNNPCRNVPSELLLGKEDFYSFFGNAIDDIKYWFADLALGKSANKQLKLMISGNGNVGKSSVLEALKNGKCEQVFTSTHGIILDDYNIDDIEFKVWDFGGQEIFHGTHRIFLSSKAVNLIVFDKLTESSAIVKDRINEEETTRNYKVDYWLHIIQELNRESPFIVAQNKIDEQERDTDVATLAATRNGSFHEISATAGKGIEVLRALIKEKAQELLDYNMPMPSSWLSVRTRINEALSEDEARRLRLIDLATFQNWCKEAKVRTESYEVLMRYFHCTGNLYYDKEHLKDTIILDQRWALEGIYTIFNREKDFYKELRQTYKGKVSKRKLYSVWGTSYKDEEKALFLNFLESCKQCFSTRKENELSTEDETFVFPEFLPERLDENANDAWEEHCSRSISLCHYRYREENLHFYKIQQIIVDLGRKTSLLNIWRNGIQIKTKEGWLRIVANYEDKSIDVCMEVAVRNKFFEEIVNSVNGNNTAREDRFKNWEELKEDGNYAPVSALKHQSIQKGVEQEFTPTVKSLAEVLPDNNKPIIMIAYAKEYQEALDMLLLHSGGYDDIFEVWYDKNLSYDEAWQKQILSKINTCNGIIILAGPHYVSPNKEFVKKEEIPAIKKRMQEDNIPVACIHVERFASPDFFGTFNFFDKAKVWNRLEKEEDKVDFMIDFIADYVNKMKKH